MVFWRMSDNDWGRRHVRCVKMFLRCVLHSIILIGMDVDKGKEHFGIILRLA